MASLKRWLDRRRNPWKGVFHDAFKAWRRENGQARLSCYDWLTPGDIVFDVGAFRGEWTDTVLRQQPGAQMHLFEPHPGFVASLEEKFAGSGNVHVHDIAIGSTTGTMMLSDAGDASSSVADHGKTFEARTLSVRDFFDATPVERIALMKVNIEGGEYDLLPALIEAGEIGKVGRLQVQFHLFSPELKEARDRVRAALEQTHDCAWSYPFVWEEWRLRA